MAGGVGRLATVDQETKTTQTRFWYGQIVVTDTTPDFTVQTVGEDTETLTTLNVFFNSPQIKSELHWFTHRETLERAANRDDRRLYYIALQDQCIAGLMIWCESRVLDPDEAQIRLVAVDPTHRNKGIGTRLVQAAVEFAREYGMDTIVADVAAETPAVAFWKACGFSKVEEFRTNGERLMYRMNRPTKQ